ncbi:GMP synthase (glutamine-hydrolyzing) [Trichoderma asperellum]|uniref:GMP synthase (glutamine-hydrolyzing) n=1 Tax=Trichoderma asperellum TaxID=101201 RepID=UPI0033185C37|nr:GMP synthase (glutamine-hydrolyzing) [Trichoderma asperellum]
MVKKHSRPTRNRGLNNFDIFPTRVMRLNEYEQVKESFDKHLGINLTVVDEAKLFLSRLKGVNEPEKKRKIIGATCIDLFQKEALQIEKEA